MFSGNEGFALQHVKSHRHEELQTDLLAKHEAQVIGSEVG